MIYYVRRARARLYMIAAYAKSDQSDLTAADRMAIRQLVRRLEEET